MNKAAGIENDRQQKQRRNKFSKVAKVNELQALQRHGETEEGQKFTEGATAK